MVVIQPAPDNNRWRGLNFHFRVLLL